MSKTFLNCEGAVLGTPWGLLEVSEYLGETRNGHVWQLRCLSCGRTFARRQRALVNHRGGTETPRNWCAPCRANATNNDNN